MPALLRPFLASCCLALAAPATSIAAPIETVNACHYDFNGTWGDIPLSIDTTAAQTERGVTLTQTTVGAELPQWLPDTLASFLGNGTHRVRIDAWIALAGEGSREGVQLRTTTGTGSTTVSGARVTPIELALTPLADSSWTALDSGGPLTLRQGGARALPAVPAAPGNNPLTPRGSVLIRAVYAPLGLRFLIDCQPGTTPNGSVTNSTTFTPSASSPLASFVFGPLGSATPGAETRPNQAAGDAEAAPVTGGAPPERVAPLAAVGASIGAAHVKLGRRAALVRVSCPAGGPACRGAARITSAARLRLSKARARRHVLGRGSYAVATGATQIVKLPLSRAGRTLRHKADRAIVTLNPSTGGAPITRRLRTAR